MWLYSIIEMVFLVEAPPTAPPLLCYSIIEMVCLVKLSKMVMKTPPTAPPPSPLFLCQLYTPIWSFFAAPLLSCQTQQDGYESSTYCPSPFSTIPMPGPVVHTYSVILCCSWDGPADGEFTVNENLKEISNIISTTLA